MASRAIEALGSAAVRGPTEYDGTARIAKLDADANPRMVAMFGVRGIPALLFFKGGKLVDQVVGAVPRARIEAVLKNRLEPVAA